MYIIICEKLTFCDEKAVKNRFGFKAMPHGSDKLPVKNRNEIRHSLWMQQGSDKSW